MYPFQDRKGGDMPDLIKKTLLTGVGLALKTWDEVEDLAKELIDKGKLNEKEGGKFIKDLQKRYEETQKKLETRVEQSVSKFLKKANVVTADELKALKKEVRDLKKMISSEKEKS
jgi:polyhydroxyalkanoate synthesis regulator phasin